MVTAVCLVIGTAAVAMILSQGTFLLPFLLASVILVRVSPSSPDAFCVIPVNGNCSGIHDFRCKQCQTLQWYTTHRSISYSFSNSILYFLDGSHEMLKTSLTVSNVSNFTMKGSGIHTSRIICSHQEGGILLFNSKNVRIKNIDLFHCGTDVRYSPNGFTVHAAVSIHSSLNLTLSGVLISNSSGLGLYVDGTSGRIKVLGSKFMYSKDSNRSTKYVANAMFSYRDEFREDSSLLIENCSFLYGYSTRHNSTKPDSSGLLILIYAPSIRVTIRNITAKSNFAPHGGNIGVLITYFNENTSTVSITDSTISDGRARKGGGLIFYNWLNHPNPESCQMIRNIHTIFSICRVNFIHNSAHFGGAVYIHQRQLGQVDTTLQKIEFTNCTFKYNEGVIGIAVAVKKYLVPGVWVHNAVQFFVAFKACQFSYNRPKQRDRIRKASVMVLLRADRVKVKSCIFSHNKGTAISLVNSNLIFIGPVLFKRNTATHGGALSLCDSSLVYLNQPTHVKFIENRAEVSGGAIFGEQRHLDSDPPCFYQPLVNRSLNVTELKRQVQFEYINNSAGIAGDAIYGGSVDQCFQLRHLKISCKNLFSIIHNLTNQNGPSNITSDPTNVRFCDPLTGSVSTEQNKTYHVFAGEQFSLSLSAVGQMNGLVPAIISINHSVGVVESHWPKYRSRELCRTVNLTVSSSNSSVTLKFFVESLSTASRSVVPNFNQMSVQVTVIIKDCPWIFTLNETQSCDCAPILNRILYTIQCSITDMSFNRGNKSVWVGCHYYNDSFNNESACDLILLTESCPKELCTSTVEWLTSSSAFKQCQDGREGVLCGRCKKGYSLTLGPQDCILNDQCSAWRMIILLLVFIIAGLILVLFLAVFNFTVSQGTMYGLLFYANVLHANQKTIGNCCSFSVIFISWLNLDFGFKLCFYSGMDAYQKVWLEFGFILYLLALAFIIVYLSHKFIFITRLLGRNVVNVLSTILLLCFLKATQTAAKALRFVQLINSSEKSLRVWYYDGNIGYLQGKHIPLALLSISVISVASFYLFSLLFIQCLQRGSGWCVLRWVNKLRPFFDAYTGPCRDQYRFWPGLLLFVLFAVFSLHVPTDINAKIQLYIALAFCVFIFVLACISPHGVYKKWPLNVLEFSFLLNLGTLCVVLSTSMDKHSSYSSVSTGMAALSFVLILVFHGYQRLSGTRKWQKLVQRRRAKPFTYLSINKTRGKEDCKCCYTKNQEINEETPFLRIPSSVQFTALRESLLSSDC